ncbi:crotonase/enoyl-CoA hydratase family protein (plasmid) [Paenarthrobacter sp. OM7]|uniref:crotonase/enoyl-CoA hydratase family protein n=1 Tax=Paenarthrobacter sp. OM7 TaxID=3041264 RepID=UPI002468F405|nr:crotonase/enoyl-CoA hydratase family protein [Paenarthrobacter sp. OM7]WGM22922.1 crotonase/enoyl-CoA hydratase family protein [Paenarthrobacter sp. OM7]
MTPLYIEALPTDDRVVTRHRVGHVYLMGLNRVSKRNAFDLEMRAELAMAYAEMEQDENIRAGVFYAHGDHFTGGLDMAKVGNALREGRGGIPEGGIDPRQLSGPQRRKPVVSAVQGWCLTLGIELLLATDIRVASEDAKFSQMEVSRGIFPFGGATIRFPREVGWGNAMRYMLTGDTFDAAEALRIGVVQEVVPTGQQLQRAYELAERISQQAPLGISTTLQSARRAQREGEQAAAKELIPEMLQLLDTSDGAEGVASFLERRPAVFTGR